jgi:hypothetical protein
MTLIPLLVVKLEHPAMRKRVSAIQSRGTVRAYRFFMKVILWVWKGN